MKLISWIASAWRLVALSMVALGAAGNARADDAADAQAAARDLYVRMSERDHDGVARYIPANGFTEVGSGGAEAHRLDMAAFDRLFASGSKIDLRLVNAQARTLGDVAIVTGVREGGVSQAGQPASSTQAPARQPVTLIWRKSDGRWLLQHVHLSRAEG